MLQIFIVWAIISLVYFILFMVIVNVDIFPIRGLWGNPIIDISFIVLFCICYYTGKKLRCDRYGDWILSIIGVIINTVYFVIEEGMELSISTFILFILLPSVELGLLFLGWLGKYLDRIRKQQLFTKT